MSRPHRSFENFALLQAASEGNAADVRLALQAGADINATDTSGRTVLTCALTADRWETVDASDASFMSQDRLDVIRTAASHPDITLFTLNAPQDSINDVTPLGMAAWLDMPQVVRLLLECSSGAVSVDAMDTDGATPLMYAARDCRMEVVQQLLSHGSRPDLRDRNHRSSIQFALPHPTVLWLCEHALRCDRWREYKNGNKEALCEPSSADPGQLSPYTSTPSLILSSLSSALSPEALTHITDSVVNAILAADLPSIYALLFSSQSLEPSPLETGPILVNLPDSDGWSAIHYCVSVPNPSVEILDALYRAGADISLFTSWEHYTPLHCLARLGRVTDASNSAQALYRFAVHLIRDLHAPLSARDRNEETCIHVAAEHGECIDVLYAFLHCDPTGSYRNLRNSRGLTAVEVAKPHFRAAFTAEGQYNRPPSFMSDRTIRPSTSMSLSSIKSLTHWVSSIYPPSPQESRGPASYLLPDFDVSTTSEQLLDHFQYLSVEGQLVRDYAAVGKLASVVKETAQLGNDILAYYRGQIDDSAKELRSVREILHSLDRQWNQVWQETEEQLSLQGSVPSQFARLACDHSPRGSEDSQSTAVEPEEPVPKGEQTKAHVDVAVLTESTQPLETTSPSGARTVPWPEWLDSFILSADSATYRAHLASLIELERVLFSRDCAGADDGKPSSKERAFKALLKSSKLHAKNEKSGSSKLKAWWKKKIVPSKPFRVQLWYDLDDPQCAVGREVKQDLPQPIITVTDTEGVTCPSRRSSASSASDRSISGNSTDSVLMVLSTASRDLSAIEECLHAIDHLISTANHFVARAERIIKRTVKTRGAMVENLRSRYAPMDVPLALLPERTKAIGPRDCLDVPDFSLSPSSLFYLSPPGSNNSGSDCSSRSSSSRSSVVSLVASQREEDEDTKALRRLILRKISAQIDGAYSEVDRVNTWLSVVRTVLRDLSTKASSRAVEAS